MQSFRGVFRFFPSARVGALVIIIAALITSVLIFRADATDAPAHPEARLAEKPERLNETDTDGDGVSDWEEELRGLSVSSSDTDGDGVSDAQEVEEERARREEEASELFADAAANFATYANLTETEKLSRGILEQVIAFQDAGISFDSDTRNDLAGLLGGSIDITLPPRTRIDASRIETVTETAASLTAYTNALGSILGGEATAQTSELIALAQFGQTGDTSALEGLSDVVATYDVIIDGLTAMTVPGTLVSKHLVLIEAFAATRDAISMLSAIQTDPVKGLAALSLYSENSTALSEAFAAVRDYLRARITLSASAPGYVIIQPVSSS